MEYVQERIATLHDLGDASPSDGPVAEAAVVVPMTDREHHSPAAARVLGELEALDPAAVVVPVRASADRIGPFREWLESFSLPIEVLWCNAPALESALTAAGIDGGAGKGRDVWLALGPAAEAGEFVVVHDADARSYEADHVRRLLAPLTAEFAFSKGYYARVERGRLYGRLFRLLYEPLIRALSARHDEPVLEYCGAFRYALAGEFAMTAGLAERLRPPRTWGLEVGTLGDALEHAGFEGTAQVDLGVHEHDHRAVAGEAGLEGMSRAVGAELLRVLEEGGVAPDYETLPARYREAGRELIAQYRADAAFNGLAYDPDGERDQLARYADAIAPPGPDRRLPRWRDAPIDPEFVRERARPWLEPRVGSASDS
ncbi:glycosyltransferase family protein [Natronococcus jeotgali]|uniref:Cell wall biogenesis glycosyltransferase n=1 Tax=Natronococcus jeotgali DSM 18795 TaxID=1227498 RepID=L9WQB8_9EURY|nr:cell wall biogenesis glycosyltransferase [Natronococcus jeotgali]ELY51577.1 cell wall biogenesis glycosyltransferase [Natronococcus jeotgali DSM 18795]